jgi:hypothetical protein
MESPLADPNDGLDFENDWIKEMVQPLAKFVPCPDAAKSPRIS